MQPSDTAYPRFKTRLTQAELERFYTPTDEELEFCANVGYDNDSFILGP